jgi:hypothetical protein
MFKLRVVQAEFGDCLVLEFGDPAAPRFVLVDGGPEQTYERHLRGELAAIAAAGGRLELAVLSHVDTDHVIGLLDLASELRQLQAGGQPPVIAVGGLWHNSFRRTIGGGADDIEMKLRALWNGAAAASRPQLAATGAALLGIGEGHKLRTDFLALGLPLNAGFANDLVCVDDHPGPLAIDNLALRVVGPTRANLDTLRGKWLEWLEAHEIAVASADPYVMANSDRSVPNLSSIMLLAEADGKRVLLTGDGRSDHLLDGLGAAGLLDAHGRLHVDLLKLPHHGSDRNVSKGFFGKVTADTYVVSANGKDDNPDLATLIWVVEAAEADGRPIEILATNRTLSTNKLVADYPPADLGYSIQFLPAGGHAMVWGG